MSILGWRVFLRICNPIDFCLSRSSLTPWPKNVTGAGAVLAATSIGVGVGLMLGCLVGVDSMTNPIGASALTIESTYLAILISHRPLISYSLAISLDGAINLIALATTPMLDRARVVAVTLSIKSTLRAATRAIRESGCPLNSPTPRVVSSTRFCPKVRSSCQSQSQQEK